MKRILRVSGTKHPQHPHCREHMLRGPQRDILVRNGDGPFTFPRSGSVTGSRKDCTRVEQPCRTTISAAHRAICRSALYNPFHWSKLNFKTPRVSPAPAETAGQPCSYHLGIVIVQLLQAGLNPQTPSRKTHHGTSTRSRLE